MFCLTCHLLTVEYIKYDDKKYWKVHMMNAKLHRVFFYRFSSSFHTSIISYTFVFALGLSPTLLGHTRG